MKEIKSKLVWIRLFVKRIRCTNFSGLSRWYLTLYINTGVKSIDRILFKQWYSFVRSTFNFIASCGQHQIVKKQLYDITFFSIAIFRMTVVCYIWCTCISSWCYGKWKFFREPLPNGCSTYLPQYYDERV